jgi:membrane-bound lytic murein transglycosylase F
MTSVRCRELARLLVILLLTSLGISCSSDKTALQRIKSSGELVIITRNGPTTWYRDAQGNNAGIEFELLSRFARTIGVKTVFLPMDSLQEMMSAVNNGDADMVAAGITQTTEHEKTVRFSRPYQTIHSQLVYKSGHKKPKSIDDLPGKKLAVIAGSSHEGILKNLQQQNPELKWESVPNLSIEEQFKRVRDGEIDYFIADSHEIAVTRRFYPKVRAAFDISAQQELAWVFPAGTDNSLIDKINAFLNDLEEAGELDEILERYYGHIERLNFVDKRTFFRHMDERLPLYREFFIKASGLTGYDWHLLAAMGYQESHWNPEARSATGVRGIMMLTQGTAEQMGVDDRVNPEQSIVGGAKYLKRVEKKIPKRIQNPDRLWFALASYNIGFAHLEDARILTQRRGGDPDKWADVKANLPDLSNPEVYKTLKYGYARGQEPIDYVENIRNFTDLLVWREQAALKESEESSLLDDVIKLFN